MLMGLRQDNEHEERVQRAQGCGKPKRRCCIEPVWCHKKSKNAARWRREPGADVRSHNKAHTESSTNDTEITGTVFRRAHIGNHRTGDTDIAAGDTING